MFWNKELEILAKSIIKFYENRLKELDNKLTIENKKVFRDSIHRIKKLMK